MPSGLGNFGSGEPAMPPSPLLRLPRLAMVQKESVGAPRAALVTLKLPRISTSSEAGSATSIPQLTRESSRPRLPKLSKISKSKVIARSIESFKFRITQRLMESATGSGSRYRTVLICEGLGNQRDGFYYTAAALQVGAKLFEGQKCYANHPSAIGEEVLPERDVRDIVGHFENVQAIKNGDHMEIQGDLVIMLGPTYDWVRSQLDHALSFSEKHTDKDFIGLSINAGGSAVPMPADKFLASAPIPDSCRPKVEQAVADGLSVIKVVEAIEEAISCDLVTQAGAGGRVLQAI